MTVEELEECFAKYHHDEYLKFDEKVEPKRSRRADLHAFLLLDELVPNNRDMVCGASHEEFFLEPELEELAKVITEEQVLELTRCGVICEEGSRTLRMLA
jgi:hypothetical protein